MRIKRLLVSVWLAGSLAACGSSNDSFNVDDSGLIQVLHAIPEIGSIQLRLGPRELNPVSFRRVSGLAQPGDAQNDLVMDVELADGSTSRLLSVAVATEVDLEKTLVLQGSLAAPSYLLFEQPGRNWAKEQAEASAPLTILEMSFAHALADLGDVDAYLGAEGFDPAAETPLATLAYSEISAKAEVESGTYEFVLTSAGDPAAILFRSGSIGLSPAGTLLMVIMTTGGTGNGPILLKGTGRGVDAELLDSNADATLRMVHAAATSGNVDVYFEDTLSTPLIADLAPASVTDYAVVPTGSEVATTVTPAGDTSVLLVQSDIALDTGSEYTLILLGAAGAETVSRNLDDNRRLVTSAKFRMMNAALDFGTLDFYLTPPGGALGDAVLRFASLAYSGSTGYVGVPPGSYELHLAAAGSETAIFGPYPVELEPLGIYSSVSVDAADSTALDLILLDDLATPPATD